jgi:hypothetical protein
MCLHTVNIVRGLRGLDTRTYFINKVDIGGVSGAHFFNEGESIPIEPITVVEALSIYMGLIN